MAYELYSWTGSLARMEFVRLALEAVGAGYDEFACEKGDGTIEGLIADKRTQHPVLAPPLLKDGPLLIGNAAVILLYLGGRLNLAPIDEGPRLWTHQLQLAIADWVQETDEVHHPVALDRPMEDQKGEALRRGKDYRELTVPYYLGFFEDVLKRNGNKGPNLVGARLSYADLSLFQMISGLNHAYPRHMGRLLKSYPRVAALFGWVLKHQRVAQYLASDRRRAFLRSDTFRFYPELDP